MQIALMHALNMDMVLITPPKNPSWRAAYALQKLLRLTELHDLGCPCISSLSSSNWRMQLFWQMNIIMITSFISFKSTYSFQQDCWIIRCRRKSNTIKPDFWITGLDITQPFFLIRAQSVFKGKLTWSLSCRIVFSMCGKSPRNVNSCMNCLIRSWSVRVKQAPWGVPEFDFFESCSDVEAFM